MAQAKEGDTVKVHCLGKLDNGKTFFTSAEQDPLQFTIGEGQTIPGFEQAVVGMNSGESKTITVEADDAYGPHREDMVLEVNRSEMPPDLKPKLGDKLKIRQENGQAIPVRVTDVSESSVTLDANHPLAGEDLTFEIQLVEIV
ncbi:MAG: peptidylprolyl isomerase [Phycisphaerae bacterium SM23_30]|nr:MAG: peptidylprolyl isomerase [Phycisphaerae bacterium SM23_30]